MASLEELVGAEAAAAGSTIHYPFSDSVVKKPNDSNGTAGWMAVLEVDRSTIVGILDRVRTLVLDWALKLERAGVSGTEFSFDAAERVKAQGSTTTINIGAIGSFAGNLGAENVAGDVTVKGPDLKLLGDLISQLKKHTDELIKDGADGSTLQARIEALEQEVKKPIPSPSIIRGLLVDTRNAVAGAAGNLIATGAVALIHQILGTGVPAP